MSLRVAVVGSGITGLAAASNLVEHGHKVTVFESDDHVGGHAWTQVADKSGNNGKPVFVDIGFQVFNQVTYPNLIDWFDRYGVNIDKSDMSLAVSKDGLEWSSDGLSSVFAQKCNTMNPWFQLMLYDMVRFKTEVLKFLELPEDKRDYSMTLGMFLTEKKYTAYFREYYIIPVCAAVWSCTANACMNFPAYFILQFMKNHHLLQLTNRPQWLVVAERTQKGYVEKVTAPFKNSIRTSTRVTAVAVEGEENIEEKTEVSSSNTASAGSSKKSKKNKGKSSESSSEKDVKTNTAGQTAEDQKEKKSAGGLLGGALTGEAETKGTQQRKVKVTSVDSKGETQTDLFDHVIFACHAPDAMKIMGKAATQLEKEIMGQFLYQENEVILHKDASQMPKKKKVWASWNFMGYREGDQGIKDGTQSSVCVSYWCNRLQNIPMAEGDLPLLVTLNPLEKIKEDLIISRQYMAHPVPSVDSVRAVARMPEIQGKRGIWWAGAYMGWGFHEDGFKSGMDASSQLMRLNWKPIPNPANFTLSMGQTMSRAVVFNFLRSFIKTGKLVVREVGGSLETFGSAVPTEEETEPTSSAPDLTSETKQTSAGNGTQECKRSSGSSSTDARANSGNSKSIFTTESVSGHKVVEGDDIMAAPTHVILMIKKPTFYSKVAIRADLGIADAYVDGDFTCNDMYEFVRLLLINQANSIQSKSKPSAAIAGLLKLSSFAGRGLAYLKYMVCDRNTVNGSRKNIHAHYDLSNEMFGLFLDPTMTYSCGIFKNPTDTLYQSQLNKLEALVTKARIRSTDTVCDVGCGWGALSLYAAKRTGCRVTGITVAAEQLAYCQELLKKESLEHKDLAERVNFELCDYRVFAQRNPAKFDRVTSCEMLEAVGHEFLGAWFKACDTLLKPHGIMVVQVITFPDNRYQTYRTETDFIREYIFPGGLCPSVCALTEAMAKNSSLMIEHIENLAPHYATTLAHWRRRFWARLGPVQHMDNDEKKYGGLEPEEMKEGKPNHVDLKKLGFDERFLRMFDYYFVYCQAGFASRQIGLHQIVYSKLHNSTLATPFQQSS